MKSYNKKCTFCGKDYIAHNALSKYCSKLCGSKAWKHNNPKKYRAKINKRNNKYKAKNNYNLICPVCQANFTASSTNAKYCSIECARANRYKQNPGKYIAYVVNRRAKKLQATIFGYDKEIETFYVKANELERQDGIKRYVHHIIPLQEFNNIGIYGLHVPWNLEIVTKEEHEERHKKLRKSYINKE